MMDLIARLEAAEAGSLELDCVMGLFGRTDGKGEVSDHFGTPCIRDAGGPYAPKPFTTSLDAALELAERVLPEETFWEMNHSAIIHGKRQFYAEVFPPEQEKSSAFWGRSSSAALSLCIAILKAKLAEEPTKG